MSGEPEEDLNETEAASYSRSAYIKWAAGAMLFAAAFFVCGFIFARVVPRHDEVLSSVEKVIKIVRSEFFFYDEETDEGIRNGLLSGLADSLDDPYARYYSGEEYADVLKSDSGTYAGVGIIIQMQEDGTCRITSLYEGGPAYTAGVCENDIILSVNGQNIQGLTLDEVIPLFHKDVGENNDMTVQRDEQVLTFSLTAAEVYTPYVHYRMLDDRMGYIHISGFHGKVAEEVRNALAELQKAGMDRLVLDVRNDLGGMLSDVRAIADAFLPKGCVITSLKTRSGKEKIYRTSSEGLSLPIAMLVNEFSASASELLAGALHDNGAAVLFGAKTYGKGIVQTTFELDKGKNGAFVMTTEAYYTPNGICIQGEGITPDYPIEMPEDVVYDNIYDLSAEEDPQLKAAMAYLNAADGPA